MKPVQLLSVGFSITTVAQVVLVTFCMGIPILPNDYILHMITEKLLSVELDSNIFC